MIFMTIRLNECDVFMTVDYLHIFWIVFTRCFYALSFANSVLNESVFYSNDKYFNKNTKTKLRIEL